MSSVCRGLLRLLRVLWPAILCLAGGALAESEPVLAGHGSGVVAAQAWFDASGQASLDDARHAFEHGRGGPADPGSIVPLGAGGAMWYRLRLAPAPAARPVVLAVPYAGLDLAEVFRADAAGRWQRLRAGDSLAVRTWPTPYMYPVFEFTPGGDGAPMFLRLQHSQPINVRWMLDDAHEFHEAAEMWYLALGACAGLLLLVVVLSVAHAVTWRDPMHLFYAVHVVLVGLSLTATTGIAGQHLWRDAPWWNDIGAVALPMAALAWMGILMQQLVAERGKPLVSRLLLAHAVTAGLLAAGLLVLGRHPMGTLPSLYALASLPVLVGVLAWYSLRRPRVGLWVLAGFSLLVAGSAFPVLRNVGLLPITFATQYGPQIGGVLEVPLVLVGLLFRSRERRDNFLRAQALSHTDPLTGLANHRVLMERLAQLLHRSARDPATGGVLRVRVANLGAIRAEWGREAEEAALVRAAECVSIEGAAADLVAREQGGDLVLLLTGRVARAQLAETGRNIIARGLKFSGRLPPGATLSLRVVGCCPPWPDASPAGLLAALAWSGDEAGEPPRRNLRILDGAAPSAPSAPQGRRAIF